MVVGTRTPTNGGLPFIGPVILENDGMGHFRNITLTSMHGFSSTCHNFAIADFDGDGDLDVAMVFEPIPFLFPTQGILFNMKRHLYGPPVAAVNSSYNIELHAAAGHFMIPFLGIAEARIPLGGLGTLFINPSAFAELPQAYFQTTGQQILPLQIPNNPSLAGRRLFLQALDLWSGPSIPGAHFTNLSRFTIR